MRDIFDFTASPWNMVFYKNLEVRTQLLVSSFEYLYLAVYSRFIFYDFSSDFSVLPLFSTPWSSFSIFSWLRSLLRFTHFFKFFPHLFKLLTFVALSDKYGPTICSHFFSHSAYGHSAMVLTWSLCLASGFCMTPAFRWSFVLRCATFGVFWSFYIGFHRNSRAFGLY